MSMQNFISTSPEGAALFLVKERKGDMLSGFVYFQTENLTYTKPIPFKEKIGAFVTGFELCYCGDAFGVPNEISGNDIRLLEVGHA